MIWEQLLPQSGDFFLFRVGLEYEPVRFCTIRICIRGFEIPMNTRVRNVTLYRMWKPKFMFFCSGYSNRGYLLITPRRAIAAFTFFALQKHACHSRNVWQWIQPSEGRQGCHSIIWSTCTTSAFLKNWLSLPSWWQWLRKWLAVSLVEDV